MSLHRAKIEPLISMLKDESGHFAVITALVAVPVLIAVGLAIDTSKTISFEKHLNSTFDGAKLVR